MKNRIQTLALTLVALCGFSVTALAHGQEFKPTYVDSLVPDYLTLQAALASDDLAAVKTSAAKLLESAKQGPEFAAFTTPVTAIASTKDLAGARMSFLTVSMEMQDLIDHVGTTGKIALYEAYCPMAFEGKGGSWIQSDKKISNPYYGSMMLRCGSVKKQIAGPQPASPASNR